MSEILGYSIFDKREQQLINDIKNSKEKVHIVSGNPEVLYNGLNNESLLFNFKSDKSIIIPDGAGVVLASKLIKEPVKEKIAGIDLMKSIIDMCSHENKSIYLLGAEQTTLEACVKNLNIKYPNLDICGYSNGFFDLNNCSDILNDINTKKPYALFVGMGCPRQEFFITKYMDSLNCKLFMGVGGSFDVLSGKLQRAPHWMIKSNLEWLYRVSKEPWRIKRLGSIPKFLGKVVLESISNNSSK
jgi:N-acetylglucosaminyldiphosphoundecaprenol N-acetyl-beta-D-mannosaminyltransferase